MRLWSYSPADVVILVGGLYRVEGLVEESFVEIEKDVEPYTSVSTPDGTIARKYNRNAEYTTRIKISSMSPSNDILTKLWQLDEITQRAKFPLMIKDTTGSGLFFSPTTWVQKPATLNFTGTQAENTWVLRSADGVINVGGNDDPSGLLEDIANIVVGSLPGTGLF